MSENIYGESEVDPVVICPKCHREHYGENGLMDRNINCNCGFCFYAFSEKGLQILMPQIETQYESIASAMRKFVLSTGRCMDFYQAPPKAMEQIQDNEVQKKGQDEEFAKLLEEYQLSTYGDCFITKELIDNICKAFENNADLMLKRQKDGIDISEMKKPKRVMKPVSSQRSRAAAYSSKYDCRQMPDGTVYQTRKGYKSTGRRSIKSIE